MTQEKRFLLYGDSRIEEMQFKGESPKFIDHVEAPVAEKRIAELQSWAMILRGWALCYLGGQEKTCSRSSVDAPMQEACDEIQRLCTDPILTAAIRAEERERCAKVCEELAELNRLTPTESMWEFGECAAAIRAMTNPEG